MCFKNCKILLCPSTHHLCMKAKEYCDYCINNSEQPIKTTQPNYSINTSNNKAFNNMVSEDDMASNDDNHDMASNDDNHDMASEDDSCIYCYCCLCFTPFTMVYDVMCIPYTIYKEVVIRKQIVDASLEEKLTYF